MMSPEVVADTAEPPERSGTCCCLPRSMAPAGASPEVAEHIAVPPEVAALTSAPCVVVPSNALSACHAELKGTIAVLSLFPDGTTIEPPEVAASAADTPGVSVESPYGLSAVGGGGGGGGVVA